MNKIQQIYLNLFKIKGQKTDMIILDKCPKCNSDEISRCHSYGNFMLPECFYKRCDDCEYQWEHS